MKMQESITYTEAGVDTAKAEIGLKRLLAHVERSLAFRDGIGSVQLEIGYFANVIDLGHGTGLAVSTDGVGTKILIAQMMDKYDTVGMDCIAMNVNDILCVGAEPISMVDYIAICDPDSKLMDEIGRGLAKGAEISNITISGGEIAIVKDMIKGVRKNREFDLVGTAIGTVSLDKVIVGENIRENDVIIGLSSSGIHSNGLSLARHIFLKTGAISEYFDELGKTIGEELLEPTHIYVPEIMEMINSDLDIKALIHITGDGFLNLNRVKSNVGFVIEHLPEAQPIFTLLQKRGNVSDEEMFRVYNMGVGFCVILPEQEAEVAIEIAKRHKVNAFRLGYAVKDPDKKVIIKPMKLCGLKNQFYKYHG
jgi:phosphoribosylformylglycinamidine cyclo-ligase